jgi:hypothetical protein
MFLKNPVWVSGHLNQRALPLRQPPIRRIAPADCSFNFQRDSDASVCLPRPGVIIPAWLQIDLIDGPDSAT